MWISDDDFTINFPAEHPFVNLNGNCNLASSSSSFICKMRNDTPADPLYYYYDYDIATAGCELDPRIYIMR